MIMVLGIWKNVSSESDSHKPEIVIVCSKDIPPNELQELCASVGWVRRDPLLLKQALLNSTVVVSAWNTNARAHKEEEIEQFQASNKLVGFARATGDGIFNATIWDVVVHPAYQDKGVGKLIMSTLVKELDKLGISLVTLMSEPAYERFYKKFGFISDLVRLRGMFREHF
jgi:ribosomal protein S18 acetylase RimI-like enzyme